MKYFTTLSLLLILMPTAAYACWDYMEYVHAEMNFSGPEMATVMVVPDGSGTPLSAASLANGAIIDATITLYVNDCYDQPIAAFPREDMWLESLDQGLISCVGGSIADANTDADGVTTWSRPLQAGGASQTACAIFINGSAVMYPSSLPLQFNSPDINGDGLINLTDVSLLAGDYYSSTYQFRSDFARDGNINLSDLAKFVPALGANCP